MSDSADSSSDSSTPTAPESSPFPGCLILTVILIVFGGLIVLYTVVGSYQNRTLDEFTETTAQEVPVLSPTSEETKETREKLRAIGVAIEEGLSERFFLTARDLNILIATDEDLADFQNQTYIERISDQGIVARMVQPMRKGVFSKGSRYLHATFVFQPELRARSVAFNVMDIRSEKGSVPEGFIQNYRALDFFRLDPEWEVMKKYIGSVEAVYTEGSQVVIETKVADPIED